MLVKLGVDISRLNPHIRRALKEVERVFRENEIEAVITSTCEGDHSPSSLHYTNDAIDVRTDTAPVYTKIHKRLKERLGPDYDIIREGNHIHIEYDPK